MHSDGGNVVASNIEEHVAGVRLCLDNHLRMPALVLIYCGIDVLAGLCRPESQPEVSSSDFIDWAERYMECQKCLGVSGIDLYAARCGVLHAYTMDSRLSAKGRARRIIYAWGNRKPDDATKVLQALGLREAVISIEGLFAAYLRGIASFGRALDDDSELASLAARRGRKQFKDQANFPGVSEAK